MKYIKIALLAIIFLNELNSQNIDFKNFSGQTESFWLEYFNNKKNISKYEGFYIQEQNFIGIEKGIGWSNSEKIVIVLINDYHYILLGDKNHKFSEVERNNYNQTFTIKGAKLKEHYDTKPSDPIYYNFWGLYFHIMNHNSFNFYATPSIFKILGTNSNYRNVSKHITASGKINKGNLHFNYRDPEIGNYENVLVKEGGKQAERNENNDNIGWSGNGTGFLIDKRGYIATNYHVVENATSIEVELDKKKYIASIITSDKINDIAILKVINYSQINENIILPYSFKSKTCDVGEAVFTLGYPYALAGMGKDIKFSDGKINSKTGYDGDITRYQVSVPIQGGNSGGPLFDNNGQVVGIISSKIVSEEIENVAYAIKISYLINLLDLIDEKIEFNSIDTKKIPVQEMVKNYSPYIALIKTKN